MINKVILEGIVGSTAYGLVTADSDEDRLGVMMLPTERFLGLHSPSESDLSVVQHEPDIAYHEVSKFCRLAAACNPTILELLWLPSELYTKRTTLGDHLLEHREKFLSAQRVRDSYMGYATSQFKRLSERGNSFSSDTRKRTEKHARHLLRLMHQGYTLYSTGILPVRLVDPEAYHEFGRMVASDPSHAIRFIEAYECKFDSAVPAIDNYPDTSYIEEEIIAERVRYL